MNSEKYTLQQAKTAKRLIKHFAKLQAFIFLMTNGKIWNKWPGGFPIMVVRTKGAKSQKIRNIPLIYVHQDGAPILVASLGGMPKNPSWYYNVKAHPNLKITTISGSGNYVAEELSKMQDNYPEVEIGSYPFNKEGQFGTSLVMRSANLDTLERCASDVAEMVKKLA